MKFLRAILFSAALVPVIARADAKVDGYKAELMAADTGFCANAQTAGVAAAFVAVATDETKLLDQKTGIGLEVVRKAFAGWPLGAKLTWAPVHADAGTSGDLGYTWGRYHYEQVTKDGKTVTENGTYVTIWKRQTDNSWKVVLDGGDPDPAEKKAG